MGNPWTDVQIPSQLGKARVQSPHFDGGPDRNTQYEHALSMYTIYSTNAVRVSPHLLRRRWKSLPGHPVFDLRHRSYLRWFSRWMTR